MSTKIYIFFKKNTESSNFNNLARIKLHKKSHLVVQKVEFCKKTANFPDKQWGCIQKVTKIDGIERGRGGPFFNRSHGVLSSALGPGNRLGIEKRAANSPFTALLLLSRTDYPTSR
jgi:hypothetical protein